MNIVPLYETGLFHEKQEVGNHQGKRRREACEDHIENSVFCVIRYSVRDIQQTRFSNA